ncbi:MAG: phosphoglycerate mutase family protein [Chloroflexota bacterium]|nr:phosphoglycerate mutase family protein [Chloroflexota bacterium]
MNRARAPEAHRVILVRHARSLVEPARHPREWGMTEEGEGAARRLAALALFEHASGFYAGPEPKMVATLAPVATDHGHEVQTAAAFAETESGAWIGEAEFYATVERFLTAPDAPPAPGWEPARVATARFAVGVERLRAAHPPVLQPGHALPGTFVIASGGRMLTAYLAQLLGLPPETMFPAWQALRMPDLAVVELTPTAPARLVIPFGTLVV